MKIKKQQVERLVREEIKRRLLEASHEVVDANSDKIAQNAEKGAPKAPNDQSPQKPPKAELEDPSDEIKKDSEGRGIGDQIVGQTIQSFSMNPESTILPGSMEIVLTFKESPEPLRILINKVGKVKFFYKTLSDTPTNKKKED